MPSVSHPSVNPVDSTFKIYPACDDCSESQPGLGHHHLLRGLGPWFPDLSSVSALPPRSLFLRLQPK